MVLSNQVCISLCLIIVASIPVMCGEEERESFQLSFLPKELLLMESWIEMMGRSSSVRTKHTHINRGGLSLIRIVKTSMEANSFHKDWNLISNLIIVECITQCPIFSEYPIVCKLNSN